LAGGNRPGAGGGNRPGGGLAGGNRPGAGGGNRPGSGLGRPDIAGGGRGGFGDRGGVGGAGNLGGRGGIGDRGGIGGRGGLGDRGGVGGAGNLGGFGGSVIGGAVGGAIGSGLGNRGGGGVGDRGNIGGGVGDQLGRPNLEVGNRNVQNNFNNINANQWNQYNQQLNAIGNGNIGNGNLGYGGWYNRAANWNRPWYGGRPAWNYGRPWYNNHYGWHSGYWDYWSSPPALWYGAGALAGVLASPGDSYEYSNPYYTDQSSTSVVVQPTLNYSDPIPAPTTEQAAYAYPPAPTANEDGTLPDVSNEPPPPPAAEDTTVSDANKLFDDARAVFKEGDYARAQGLVEQAIALLPSDATLHEFRGLTLFAQKKYKEAAAGLYAVLAAGPGWNWETMSALYPSRDVYTEQLRALEAYTRSNPKAAYAHFLLAYHYLVLKSKDAAVKQLKEVVQLEPKDKLSAALVQALTSKTPAPADGPPQPGGGG